MTIADRFPTLARQWTVLRTSWRMQNEADATARPISDHEFLPAALEIMEKPPSPGLRILTLAICGLFTLALIWSFIGKFDVVAVASGRTLPQANTKVIQPIEIGAVRAIHVRNGQRVRKGDLLIELDPTIATADEAQAGHGLLTAEIAKARNGALLAFLAGRPANFVAPSGTPEEVALTQQQMIASAIAAFEAQRASLRQSRAERAAELMAAEGELAKLRETLPLIDQQLDGRRKLAERGYYSKLKLLEYEQLRVEHGKNIEIQSSNAARARAAVANIDAQLAELTANFTRTSADELAKAQDESSLRGEELIKSARRREYQAIRSPVDGTVQQLAVTTIGGIVQPAQPLMLIVPDGSDVHVEAHILNKDIGFIREGQPVRVKLEAYPFTDYGLVQGVVETISRDAIDLGAQQGAERDKNNRPVQPGLVYAARIRLKTNSIRVGGQNRPIGAGLAVQAEIKTGERRIIQYLLSPIAKTMDEAAQER
jgi:hemolysin D